MKPWGLIRQVVVSFKVNEATKQFLLCIFELFNRVIAMISGRSGRTRQSIKRRAIYENPDLADSIEAGSDLALAWRGAVSKAASTMSSLSARRTGP